MFIGNTKFRCSEPQLNTCGWVIKGQKQKDQFLGHRSFSFNKQDIQQVSRKKSVDNQDTGASHLAHHWKCNYVLLQLQKVNVQISLFLCLSLSVSVTVYFSLGHNVLSNSICLILYLQARICFSMITLLIFCKSDFHDSGLPQYQFWPQIHINL